MHSSLSCGRLTPAAQERSSGAVSRPTPYQTDVTSRAPTTTEVTIFCRVVHHTRYRSGLRIRTTAPGAPEPSGPGAPGGMDSSRHSRRSRGQCVAASQSTACPVGCRPDNCRSSCAILSITSSSGRASGSESSQTAWSNRRSCKWSSAARSSSPVSASRSSSDAASRPSATARRGSGPVLPGGRGKGAEAMNRSASSQAGTPGRANRTRRCVTQSSVLPSTSSWCSRCGSLGQAPPVAYAERSVSCTARHTA